MRVSSNHVCISFTHYNQHLDYQKHYSNLYSEFFRVGEKQIYVIKTRRQMLVDESLRSAGRC